MGATLTAHLLENGDVLLENNYHEDEPQHITAEEADKLRLELQLVLRKYWKGDVN